MGRERLVGDYRIDSEVIQKRLDDLFDDRRLIKPSIAPYGQQVPRVDQQLVEVVTPDLVGSEFAVGHSLQRVPIGCIIVGSSEPVQLYDGDRALWSRGRITLRADAAGVVVRIIVL